MADMTRKVVTIYIFVLLACADSKKLDKNGFKQLLSGRVPPPLQEPTNGAPNSILKKIQVAFADMQKVAFDDISAIVPNSFDGAESAKSGCIKCNSSSKPLNCYANCIDKDNGLQLAKIVDKLFCVPIGLRFFENYFKNNSHPIWVDFQYFWDQFHSHKDSMSKHVMVQVWLSNLFLLDRSPMAFYTLLYHMMKVTLVDKIEGINSITADSWANDCETNNEFGAAAAPLIHALSANAKNHPYLNDIFLKGLFLTRSAYFYTLGNYQNAMGAVLEGLNAFIGRRCDLLSEGAKNDKCDDYGRVPIPHFPIPDKVAEKIGIDCNPKQKTEKKKGITPTPESVTNQ